MGYYTYYKLSVKNTNDASYNAFDLWIETKPKTTHGYSWKSFLNGNADQCKWYEHEEDMIALSLQYPNLIFLLEGSGEESGDMWKKYFKNGQMQIVNAKIIFDEFDESRLVKPKPKK